MHILIVGAGQLGSRYLQGLATCKDAHQITLLDPSDKSLMQSVHRFEDSGGNKDIVECHLKAPKTLPEIDLAIVSTLSSTRLNVVQDLNKNYIVKRWILEKLLAQSSSDVNKLENLLEQNPNTWVNTPRRTMKWYQHIKNHIKSKNVNNKCLKITVRGGNWGLCCNAIHFIDLVEWLTESKIQSCKAEDYLQWHHAKRDTFWEARGKLLCKFEQEQHLELNSDNSNNKLVIQIKSNDFIMNIDESLGFAADLTNKVDIFGGIDYQSALTASLVDEIVNTNNCELPSLKVSARQHKILLDSLSKDYRHRDNKVNTNVPLPIT